MVAVIVGDDDRLDRPAGDGGDQRVEVRRIVRAGIDDRQAALADQMRPGAGMRVGRRIVAQHARDPRFERVKPAGHVGSRGGSIWSLIAAEMAAAPRDDKQKGRPRHCGDRPPAVDTSRRDFSPPGVLHVRVRLPPARCRSRPTRAGALPRSGCGHSSIARRLVSMPAQRLVQAERAPSAPLRAAIAACLRRSAATARSAFRR